MTEETRKKNAERSRLWYHANKERALKNNLKLASKYRAMNPDWMKKAKRKQLLRAYGLDELSFAQMLEAQDGNCSICFTELLAGTGGRAVDHCHASGKVRSILCGKCNRALGLFNDNPALLRAAADYVEFHSHK